MKKAFLIAIILLLLFSGAFAVYRYRQKIYLPEKRISEAREKQEKLFEQVRPDVDNIPAAKPISPDTEAATAENGTVPDTSPVEAVREVCSDAVGWLYVPDTGLDYPIAQGDGNSFYLSHGLDGEFDPFGLTVLDYRCEGDFSGYNSIIYAHNYENMAMFAPVGLFRDSSYMDSHRQGCIITDRGREDIEFFAYLTVPSDSPVYNTVFITDKAEITLSCCYIRQPITAISLRRSCHRKGSSSSPPVPLSTTRQEESLQAIFSLTERKTPLIRLYHREILS